MSIGPLEIVIVLVLALLVFGPKQLPQAGRSLGHALREFRKATQSARTELGLDEVAEGVKDLKSSMSVDLGLKDIKSSMSVDLSPSALAAAVVGPAADKPVPVAAAGSDTTPPQVTAVGAAPEPTADGAAEAVDEPPAADAVDEPPEVTAVEAALEPAIDEPAAAPEPSADEPLASETVDEPAAAEAASDDDA